MNGLNQEGQPDPLDVLLSRLPEEPVPAELAARIYANILAHRRRHVTVHFAISVFLALAGIWLALPGFTEMLQSLSLPESGWPLVTTMIGMAQTGAARMSADLISAVASYQSHLSNPSNGVAWVGMIVLAGGCLLALQEMLPHNEG